MLQSTYLPQTRRLLQNPSAPVPLYSDPDLTFYINMARGQMAGETMCVRAIGTLATAPGQQVYSFADMNLGVAALTGVQGAINVSTIWYQVGAGQKRLRPDSWEWFGLYQLNTPVPKRGVPKVWTQYGQGAEPPGPLSGSSFGGSIYLDPIPDQSYTLLCDCSCYPIPLVADTDVEAIPYLWTDAVPFFAAYYALLSSQTTMRTREAKEYYQSYEQFVGRARGAANPLVNNYLYQQATDPIKIAKLATGGGNQQ